MEEFIQYELEFSNDLLRIKEGVEVIRNNDGTID